jgi:hypothetical protein
MHTPPKIIPPSSKFDKMVSEQDIEKAINVLNAQLIPNYSQVARDFGIERTTLMRRYKVPLDKKQPPYTINFLPIRKKRLLLIKLISL